MPVRQRAMARAQDVGEGVHALRGVIGPAALEALMLSAVREADWAGRLEQPVEALVDRRRRPYLR